LGMCRCSNDVLKHQKGYQEKGTTVASTVSSGFS
jgi:hypothetical protein